MQNFDPALETRIIKTVLDRKSGTLLTSLNKDWFGMPVVQEIWSRIEVLKTNGKIIPTSETMATDPVLSENAHTLLKGSVNPFEDSEIEGAVEQMNRYREGRHLWKMVENVANICKSNNADLKLARAEIENCLKKMEIPSHDKDILSYGAGVDHDKAIDLYNSLMDMNMSDVFIPTGFSVIDNAQGGLARGRVYTIGAPSGGGKSTFVNCMAVNMYRKANRSVGYFSFEMNPGECLLRTQAAVTRIPSERFQLRTYTDADRKKSDRMFAQFLTHGEKNGCRLDYICPSKDINIIELFQQAEALNHDVVIVDYINLMAKINPKAATWEDLGEAFRLAKRWAEKTQKVVIMLVQIDEETGSIKYAKSIKHHSDGVWVWKWGEAEKETGLVEVEQVKLRNLKPGKFQLQAEFEFCMFSELPIAQVTTPVVAKSMNL